MKLIIRREPAVLLGLAAAICTGIAALITDGTLSWETAVPVVLGIITRAFVSPASPPDIAD
jgi:type IV secretory pathway VirB2 component (pilin)